MVPCIFLPTWRTRQVGPTIPADAYRQTAGEIKQEAAGRRALTLAAPLARACAIALAVYFPFVQVRRLV